MATDGRTALRCYNAGRHTKLQFMWESRARASTSLPLRAARTAFSRRPAWSVRPGRTRCRRWSRRVNKGSWVLLYGMQIGIRRGWQPAPARLRGRPVGYFLGIVLVGIFGRTSFSCPAPAGLRSGWAVSPRRTSCISRILICRP